MEIGIIGGGITGLTVAYQLSRKGLKVVVFEKESILGGLASSIKVDGINIEKYYHFICLGDRPYLNLLEELGLAEKLCWTETRMSYFSRGKMYPFSTPWDLLKFSPLGLIDRFRFGFNIFYTSRMSDWKSLDRITAREWLIKHIGKRAYQEIWEPLIRTKFGNKADEISAAWIWGRAKRVANSRVKGMQREKLGYVKGGTQTLIDELERRIFKQGGEIKRDSEVTQIAPANKGIELQVKENKYQFRRVISTVPLPLLLKLAPSLPPTFRQRLREIEYYGVVCIFLRLKRKITHNFWLNTHDPRISFAGIIEYSNLNPLPELGGSSIAYIPYYLRTDDELYNLSPDTHYQRLLKELKLINPEFEEDWIEYFNVFKDDFAQPICTVNHLDRMPSFRTPVDGLYIAEMSQIYPEDRGVSNAIDIGTKVSSIIVKDCLEEDKTKAQLEEKVG